MKFFIDTANVNEIKKGLEMGLVDGVTTNPSLLAKEKKNPDEVIKEIVSLVPWARELRGALHTGEGHAGRGAASCGDGEQRGRQDTHDGRGHEGG